MAEPIEAFFDAWGITDPAKQSSLIASVFSSDGTYADPRSNGLLSGPKAIADYVAMFAANAPGWTAQVVNADEIIGKFRVTVAFGGEGPDGSAMLQHGQYFVEQAEGKIIGMTGFAGVGATE